MDFEVYIIFIVILVVELILSILLILNSRKRYNSSKSLDKKLSEILYMNNRLYSDSVINSGIEMTSDFRDSLHYNFYDDDTRRVLKRLYLSQESIQEELSKLNILLSSPKSTSKSSNRNANIDALKLVEQIANMTNTDFLLELLKTNNDKKYIVTRNVISDIAHTLRTPLSGIHAIILTLEKNYPEQTALLTHITEIDKCISQVEENIQAYQDLMLSNSDADENDQIPFMDKLHSRLRIAMITSDKKLYIDCAEIEPITPNAATSKLLLLAIDCIIENATYFANDNSTIKVCGKYNDDYYLLEIQNDGKPIEEKHLKNIFEQGFSTRYSSGKGLFFVKNVIEERLGGIVDCQNIDGPTKGVKFTIALEKSKLETEQTKEELKENGKDTVN